MAPRQIVRALVLASAGCLAGCGSDVEFSDDTHLVVRPSSRQITKVALRCTFDDDYRDSEEEFVRTTLAAELQRRGIAADASAPAQMVVTCRGPWEKTSGVTVKTRRAKVAFDVNLRESASGEPVLEGEVDGLVVESDVSPVIFSPTRARIRGAIKSAVSKLGPYLARSRVAGARARPPDRGVSGGPVRKRFAVLIGLSEYKYRGKWSLTNLRYAARDAAAMAAYLKTPRGGRFDEVILLTNDRATRKNVKAAIAERLRGAQRDDLLLIYWSGHGTPDPRDTDRLYLVAYDTDPAHMRSTGYGMKEFQSDIADLEAQRVVILADTCHSAGIADPNTGTRGVEQNKIVEGMKGVFVAAEKAQGTPPTRLIFTSCEAGEVSRESADLGGGHGVFTWFMLQGLSGDADRAAHGGNADRKVTLGELIEYTRDRVKRFTGNRQHPDTAGWFDRELEMGRAE